MPMVGMESSAVMRGGEGGRDLFQHDRESARLLAGMVIGEDAGRFGVAAHDLVCRQRVHGLRGEADMGHDGDAARREEGDGFGHVLPPSRLYRRGAGFGHEAGGVAIGLLGAFP